MSNENRMATEPIGRLLLQMSLPPLFSMFLQYSYNLADSAFVARLSEDALTAVSLSFPLTTLMNAVSTSTAGIAVCLRTFRLGYSLTPRSTV